MEEKVIACAPAPEANSAEDRKVAGYMGNFVRQPKGGRVSVFGEGYVRPNIINMPEDEQ